MAATSTARRTTRTRKAQEQKPDLSVVQPEPEQAKPEPAKKPEPQPQPYATVTTEPAPITLYRPVVKVTGPDGTVTRLECPHTEWAHGSPEAAARCGRQLAYRAKVKVQA